MYEAGRMTRLTPTPPDRVAFNVWQYASFETAPGISCEGFSPSRLDGTMTDVLNGRCKLSARTFNLTFCERGATLRVTGPVSVATNLTGETLLPVSDWKIVNDNKADVLNYIGPTELELAAVL